MLYVFYAFLCIALSLLTCYAAQRVLRGTETAKITEDTNPKKSFWSDAAADFIFAVLLAVLMAKYTSIWPANSLFATPALSAYAGVLIGVGILWVIEKTLPSDLIFSRMLARKTAYRVTILVTTLFAILALTAMSV
ncbi:hypothetical protein ACK83U_13290 [Rhizobium sp. WW22]|uniref:hypothetical protein n=1 Tax=Rhizobium sp. WW22 TaxID=3389070 RepID=UPI00399BF3BE